MTILSKPMRRPVPLACSTTCLALLFLVAGARGYTLSRHDAFVAGTPWIGGVIVWEVAVGVVLLALSIWLWRRAIHSLRA